MSLKILLRNYFDTETAENTEGADWESGIALAASIPIRPFFIWC